MVCRETTFTFRDEVSKDRKKKYSYDWGKEYLKDKNRPPHINYWSIIVGPIWTDLTPVLPPDRWGESAVVPWISRAQGVKCEAVFSIVWKKRGCLGSPSELKDRRRESFMWMFCLWNVALCLGTCSCVFWKWNVFVGGVSVLFAMTASLLLWEPVWKRGWVRPLRNLERAGKE